MLEHAQRVYYCPSMIEYWMVVFVSCVSVISNVSLTLSSMRYTTK